jgi:hypothetical protein
MSFSSVALLLGALAVPPDTTVSLGVIRRDLTGDGKAETLRLIGVGRTIDSLAVTLSIESSGRIIYRASLVPLTHRVSYDADRRMRSRSQQRKWVAGYGRWFFGDAHFKHPAEFVTSWRDQAPARIAKIAQTIARDGSFFPDTARGTAIWTEMRREDVTIFEFPTGGDAVIAIGWSAHDARFYRLVECC